jgi:hypothetical protein
MHMPSRALLVPLLGALVTAGGLAATTGGAAHNSTPLEMTGLGAIALGVVPLLVSAMRSSRDRPAEEIQGEAFALALELCRNGQLEATAPTKSATENSSHRYDL